MTEPRPAFTAHRKTPPAIGWMAEATRPNGQVDMIEGFSSEAKALNWIAELSETWPGNDVTGQAMAGFWEKCASRYAATARGLNACARFVGHHLGVPAPRRR